MKLGRKSGHRAKWRNLGRTEQSEDQGWREVRDMQPDADDTSLAFCQMMQAKDEQIRRLVLRMER